VRPGNSSTQFEPKREERDIMKNLIKRFVREEEGQDLIEYALLAALITIVGAVGISAIGTKVAGIWTNVLAAL
jgi:pilus assembly protein Flp/PilA